ncbi:HlyD family efflux transporter periplasmic adaptor subunit [Breoghania sp.]|uniref:efflux RND transporter periplasmic adaptor subunit n=1 Tax=Breoghania sp. TaxID=2065378 RepID=UPI002AA759FF|nr:HlyD family efflux transporter periplasmic adaptor subunit [Breoghania sp.]
MLKTIDTDTGEPASDASVNRQHRAGADEGAPDGPRRRLSAVTATRAVAQAVIAAVILVGAVYTYFHLVGTREPIPSRPEREQVYVVRTVAASVGDQRPIISLYGEVVAARTVELRALVAGKIVNVSDNLQAGSPVDAGDSLVEIDRFAYEGALVEAKANLAEARARLIEAEGGVARERANVDFAQEQLTFAERDLERGRQLLARGSATERTIDDRALVVSQRRQQLDQRRSALAVEDARVEQQKATIARLEWKLQEAEQALADTTLAAPFDAVVRSEGAAVGRLVNVNDVVAVLYDRNALEARFTLSDNQYGRLLGENGTLFGREVEVIWYIGNDPVTFSAQIVRVGADVASERGGVDVFARIEADEAEVPLRPGAFVELRVPDKLYPQAVRLPETAIYGGKHVYAVVEDRLERRNVNVIAYEGSDVIVQGDIAEGERILRTQISQIGNGLLVREEGQTTAGPGPPGKSPDAPASEGARP